MDFLSFYVGFGCASSLFTGFVMVAKSMHESAERTRRIEIARRRHLRGVVRLIAHGAER